MSDYKIKLSNVRLSFPSIFTKSEFNGTVGKFEATFLMNKDSQAKMIADVQAKIALIQKDNKAKVSPDKICLKDGEFVEYDGYANAMSIKAGSNRRPTIIDRDKTPLVEDDNKPYAGNLTGIQFVKDGEAFGAGNQDSSDEFDDISDDDMMG